MKRAGLAIVLVVTIATIVGWAYLTPGSVQISVNNAEFLDISYGLAITLYLGSLFGLWLIWDLLAELFFLPERAINWWRQRRAGRERQKLNFDLMQLLWSSSLEVSMPSLALTETTPEEQALGLALKLRAALKLADWQYAVQLSTELNKLQPFWAKLWFLKIALLTHSLAGSPSHLTPPAAPFSHAFNCEFSRGELKLLNGDLRENLLSILAKLGRTETLQQIIKRLYWPVKADKQRWLSQAAEVLLLSVAEEENTEKVKRTWNDFSSAQRRTPTLAAIIVQFYLTRQPRMLSEAQKVLLQALSYELNPKNNLKTDK